MPQAQINRRKALTVVAAAPAAVALGSAVAASEDAELLRLFEEWKAQNQRVKEATAHYEAVNALVADGLGPNWEFVSVKGDPWRAVFISRWHFDATQKIVPLKARNFDAARNEAMKVQASLLAECRDNRKAAERKHKWASVERAFNASHRRLREIEDQIAQTPAEGLTGVAIKLALCVGEEDFMQEPAVTLIATAYETLKRVTGTDYLAEIERW
jgi:hypothetical protein